MAVYRHEWKAELNEGDLLVLRQRLRRIMQQDPHAIHGFYQIRSLYFDTPEDRALREKIDGVNRREKFRLRCYNGDTNVVFLEKKSKCNGLSRKESLRLTTLQVKSLLEGQSDWWEGDTRPLVQELHSKMIWQGLRPRVIVEYTREPFVYGPGNVRVTLDQQLRTGLFWHRFLESDAGTIPAGVELRLLEVKWDSFLPELIRDAVQLPGRRCGSFSKYAQCRIYG